MGELRAMFTRRFILTCVGDLVVIIAAAIYGHVRTDVWSWLLVVTGAAYGLHLGTTIGHELTIAGQRHRSRQAGLSVARAAESLPVAEREAFLKRANEAFKEYDPMIKGLGGLVLPVTTAVAALVWVITRLF